jgi:hypothetical protein
LWGWAYVDGRGITTGGYAQGDEWMAAIAKAARDKGFPVIYDNKGPVFRNHYPLREAALYFGWYTEHPSGPFVRMDAGLKPGSIAVHLHSFSASTVRDPLRYWAGPLLASGAAATLGNVYEPYLDLTPHLDVFMERLFSGFTLGESAYASAKGLSWMTTVIGDPLYRPFAIFHDLARETPENVLHRPWKEYRDAALERKTDKPAGTRAIRAVAAKWRTGMPMEALAMLQFAEGRPELAFESLKEAGSLYVSPTDKLRVALHEIEYLIQRGRKQDALAVVRKLKPLYALGSDRQLLDALEKELDPPPAPTPSPTPFSPNSQPLPAR